MKHILTALLLAIALPSIAAEEPQKPAEFSGPAWMCSGPYALCIRAQCEDKPDANGNVPCQCINMEGWNMGPNSCAERKASLTSTYSNNFNDGARIISCPASTEWAWCYGAKCVKDPNNPNYAICMCPTSTKPTLILVSTVQCANPSGVCAKLWSGALPAESKFANEYFYWWLTSHGLEPQAPAQACPPPPAK